MLVGRGCIQNRNVLTAKRARKQVVSKHFADQTCNANGLRIVTIVHSRGVVTAALQRAYPVTLRPREGR